MMGMPVFCGKSSKNVTTTEGGTASAKITDIQNTIWILSVVFMHLLNADILKAPEFIYSQF